MKSSELMGIHNHDYNNRTLSCPTREPVWPSGKALDW